MQKRMLMALGAGMLLDSAIAHAGNTPVDDWLVAVSASQAEQPHWVTPLVTVTPRLEQEYRFDYVQQGLPDGTRVDNFGNAKGLEFIIPHANVEVALNAPGYLYHPDSGRKNGYTDSSVLFKYRISAANEENGNYIVTLFLSESFATGSAGVGNTTRVYTPTLAAGKGFGDFDVQATLGYSLPDTGEQRVGHQASWNTALQYHFAQHYWPEIEYNQLRYTDGANNGETQGSITAGMVSKWPLEHRVAAVFGIGYQHPVTTFHTYAHAVVATARLAF